MIAAVIASHGRFPLLARLLQSLRRSEPVPRVIVVDNLGGDEAARVVREAGLPAATVLAPGSNLGTGGAVALGFSTALADPAIRFCAQLDDDSTVASGTLAELARVLEKSSAGAATPMVLRADGAIGWFAGLQDRSKWRVILRARQHLSPEDYLAACGPEPVPFTWAPWPVLLVKREAIERVGLPRADIWFHGVDLEYTLRLAVDAGNLFVPTARAWHLPPEEPTVQARAYARDCLGLQNCSYVFARLPHGRLALKHLPGTYRRFFCAWGFSRRALADAGRCFYWGTVLGKPAGAPGYTRFREKWLSVAGTERARGLA